MTQSPPQRSTATLLFLACLLLLAAVIILTVRTIPPSNADAPENLITPFTIPIGKVATPLPTRIISFHRGRADKNLIRLASHLGFNGVQFQLEGSNEQAILDFASRDAREHLVDFCHAHHMAVTLWVHELSDLPGPWLPESLGPESADNDRLFDALRTRYEWILTQAVPNIDGLALTVVETQVRATQTPILLRLCDLISGICKEHNKSFMLRTFVWHPDELQGVMGAVHQLPHDTMLMTKCVAQDWQMRGVPAPEVKTFAAEHRPWLMEFDVEGEYFLHNMVANCMPDLLKHQLDYAEQNGAQGICVRVDRFDDSILFQPSEVNLWALGLLSAGAAQNTDQVWQQWAAYRYPELSPAGRDTLIKALKPTADVVAEMLSVGPFTHGDTRRYPPLPDEPMLTQNWQNWQWDPSYLPAYEAARRGDPQFIAQVAAQKAAAMKRADQSLAELATLRTQLPPIEWAILETRLQTNKAQLAFRAPMVLASLEYRAMQHARTDAAREAARRAAKAFTQQVRQAVSPLYPPPLTISYLGRLWQIGPPQGIDRNALLYWCYSTDELLDGTRDPLPEPIDHNPDPLHP